jgi:branched-chain amino acid transport system substrate-binding protein
MRGTSRATAATLIGLSLLAAACGSSKSSTATGTTTAATTATTASATTAAATTAAATTVAAATTTVAAGPPQSMDEWNALWTKERAAVVKRITDNKWGLSADGKTITGPEGFTVDVSKCGAGWNNMEGLSDTEIKIGQAISQSGTLAIYGQIANGITKWFDVINKTGITDSTGKTRKITYTAKDDGYDPARTIPIVDELIDSEKVFDVWTLGSPNTLKVYDKLNQRCIPQALAMTGHPAWGDPVNHPWTTGAPAVAYNTEAVLWGAFVEQHAAELKGADGKITVAALVMNNDFGKAYIGGFKAWLAQTSIKSDVTLVTETIEPSAPTVTDPMTTLASKNPAVFIAMTAGTSCTQAITEAAQNGLKEKAKYLFDPQTCKSNGFIGKDKVGGDGSASNGWYVVGGGTKTLESASYDNDPFAKYARDLMTAGGLDWKKESLTLTGVGYVWPMEQMLRIASALPGGLTRANFLVAMRSIDMTAPFVLPGVKFNLNGNKDGYMIEASEFAKYDSAKQSFAQDGKVIELSGKSTNCAWDQAAGACK